MEKPQIQDHTYFILKEIQKWSMFLSIVGFVMLGLGVFVMMLMLIIYPNIYEYQHGAHSSMMLSRSLILFFYMIGFIISFFPVYYLYKFSSKLKQALSVGDDNVLTDSFTNLKKHYQFLGILTIIGIVIYAGMILFAGLGFLIGRGL